MPAPLSYERKRDIAVMLRAGSGYHEIMAALRVAGRTIRRVKRELGIDGRPKGQHKTLCNPDPQLIADLRSSGLKWREIAHQLGMSRDTLRIWRRRNGYPDQRGLRPTGCRKRQRGTRSVIVPRCEHLDCRWPRSEPGHCTPGDGNPACVRRGPRLVATSPTEPFGWVIDINFILRPHPTQYPAVARAADLVQAGLSIDRAIHRTRLSFARALPGVEVELRRRKLGLDFQL